MSRFLLILACGVSALALAERPALAQNGVRLTVQPAALDLVGPDARHGLLVTATGPDGVARDVTAQASFAASKPCVVALAEGQVRCVGDGTAEVVVDPTLVRPGAIRRNPWQEHGFKLVPRPLVAKLVA